MRASATFEVTEFSPTDYASPITTGSPIGHAHLRKRFTGEIEGVSTAQFSAAFDQATGVGTYVALEAFQGSLHGRSGAFAFAHTGTTDGVSSHNTHPLLVIAPGSGTQDLAGIEGTGSLEIDEDDTHRLHLEYTLPR